MIAADDRVIRRLEATVALDRRHGSLAALLLAALAMVVWEPSPFGGPAAAQNGAPASAAAYDESIRPLQYYRYKRVAESGPERGRELFYFKCWQCHNEFQKTAPQLKGLYQRANLISGDPVNDATVADKVRNGGPGMPSFRHQLSDADVADGVSFVPE